MAEWAAEKRDFMRAMERRGKAQGLKPTHSIGLIGTTTSRALLQSLLHRVFPQLVKPIDSVDFIYGLNTTVVIRRDLFKAEETATAQA